MPVVGPFGVVADDFTPETRELGDTVEVFAWQDRAQPPELHERHTDLRQLIHPGQSEIARSSSSRDVQQVSEVAGGGSEAPG